MSNLRKAAQNVVDVWNRYGTVKSLRGWMGILEAALEQPEHPRRLTDDQIGQIWFAAKIPGLTESDARRLIRAAEEAR